MNHKTLNGCFVGHSLMSLHIQNGHHRQMFRKRSRLIKTMRMVI
jgi:3-dehydroquinate dehydratase